MSQAPELKPEDLDSPLAKELIQELDTELLGRYPQASVHGLVESKPVRVFLVAWLDNQPAGCGGVAELDDGAVEIKRMFVRRAFRGRGIARTLLGALEQQARDLGYTRICLETGDRQPEANSLYESAGYARIPNYGEYIGDPHSMCYAKQI